MQLILLLPIYNRITHYDYAVWYGDLMELGRKKALSRKSMVSICSGD